MRAATRASDSSRERTSDSLIWHSTTSSNASALLERMSCTEQAHLPEQGPGAQDRERHGAPVGGRPDQAYAAGLDDVQHLTTVRGGPH